MRITQPSLKEGGEDHFRDRIAGRCRLLLIAFRIYVTLACPVIFSSVLRAVDLPGSFDAGRALAHVEKMVAEGPRPSGSDALVRTRDYLVATLQGCGWEVRIQSFEADTPRGKMTFHNVIASLPKTWKERWFGQSKPLWILGSHYDTKWMKDISFVGANDGGSSTGVLLEVARVLGETKVAPSSVNLELIFFDGEEAMVEYSPTDGLYGSRHYVAEAEKQFGTSLMDRIQAMLLLDMIGDRDLNVRIPLGDSTLTRKIFEASEAQGFREHFRLSSGRMLDDHWPFEEAGIPALDLIDFDYGPDNRWWHTSEDTLDKLSAKSLNVMGKTLLQFLQDL